MQVITTRNDILNDVINKLEERKQKFVSYQYDISNKERYEELKYIIELIENMKGEI